MDGQRTLGRLTNAIPADQIRSAVSNILKNVENELVTFIEQFSNAEVTPLATFDLEETLAAQTREVGREVLQWLVGAIEPADLTDMPGTIRHKKKNYRRLADKAPNSNIVTPFGRIAVERSRFRQGRAGRTIFPLEIALGIEKGFTPAAADMVGRQFATCGSSQGRTIESMEERIGTRIGSKKLRNLVALLAQGMEPYREEHQLDQLLEWIKKAREAGQSPVISVSRDGVSLGIAKSSSFEMAAIATVTVMSEGKKLGTVYLGRAPETNQETLSENLTSLLKATVRGCGESVPDIIYVTDAGKVETAYWKNVLRKFFVDGRRIKIRRVLDYYHASERLTTIANALKFGKKKQRRENWLSEMRKLLLEPGGWGRVMRSIAKMKSNYGYKRDKKKDADNAEKYLRRYQRFMNYHELRSQNFPIGSGIVESACKQVVSERLKLSGMRWQHAGAQDTISLRCLLLSKIWRSVYRTYLSKKAPVIDLLELKAA